MNCRTISMFVGGFSLAGLATATLAAPFSLGELAVVPRVVPVGAPTTVTATIQITDTSYIAGSAALFSTDANGKLLTRLALFVDDGTKGDRVAGDRIHTARWAVSEPARGVVPVVATAAFRGTLLRVGTRQQFIEVAPDADPTTPKATMQGNALLFLNSAGGIAREVPVISVEDHSVGGVIQRTVREVLISADQGRAGVFEFAETAPQASTEVLEFSTIGARFRMYSAKDGELATIAVPEGKSFFIPSSRRLLSRKGERVVLVAVDEADTDPQVLVYTELGGLLYQSPERFGFIRDVAISPDGRYLAYIAVRDGVVAPETVFRVIEVDTRREWEKVFDPSVVDSTFFVPAAQGFALFLNGAISASFP